MKKDQGIAWIRKVRHEISEECGHDPKKLVAYMKTLETKYQDRIVKFEEASKKEKTIG